jgi:hypothetical protein
VRLDSCPILIGRGGRTQDAVYRARPELQNGERPQSIPTRLASGEIPPRAKRSVGS